MALLIFWIIVVGIVVYVVRRSPIDEFFKVAVYALCAIWVLWLLYNAFVAGLPAPGLYPHR